MRKICWVIIGTSLTCLAVRGAPAFGQGASVKYGELLKRIPTQTNVLMMVDVDGLYNSPLGKTEKWREQAAEKSASAGRFGLAPDITKLVVAMGADIQTLNERWKIGMVQLGAATPNLEALANREGGFVEKVANTPVVWTPRGFYLFKFPDGIIGFVSPSNRQGIADWIRAVLIHPRTFPPSFADRAIYRADRGAQIVLVINLADTVSAKSLEPWLNTLDEVKKAKLSPELLAQTLASVNSAFFQVDVKQGIEGTIRVDFDQSIDYGAVVMKDLILTVLEDSGALLPELKAWTTEFDKNKKAIELRGRLSEQSARRILSLASPPRLSSSPSSTEASTPVESQSANPVVKLEQSDVAKISQGYFRSVVDLLDDLKRVDRPTYRATKLWYDRYSKQIEELPIIGVDKDLLDWGSQVSRTLREMAYGINSAAQTQVYNLASVPNGYYGGYGYYAGNSKEYSAATIKKQSDAQMSVGLDSRWETLQISIADLRRKMVEKYRVDF